MTTLKLKYLLDSIEDKELIYNYLNQYNHCFRVSYNLLKDHKSCSQKILSSLNHIDLLDSWFIQSSIYDVKSLIKLVGDQKVIFGGKSNFIKRCKNKISKEEFNSRRLSPICSFGEKKSGTKGVHGNRKFKLSDDLSKISFKTKEKKIDLVLPNLKPKVKNILSKIYEHQLLDDIPITYKLDLNYIYISFDETILSKDLDSNKIENRIFSIDLNPNYIGWSVIDWKSSNEFSVIKTGIISSKLLNDKELSLKNQHISSDDPRRIYLHNKREHEIYEISKSLINKALYYKCSIFSIEDLSMKSSDKSNGKKFNALCNNLWNRNKLVNNLQKRCNIFNVKLLKVKPEYSSFIGNFLFRDLNLPDMVLASIEISRRTYEFYNQYVINKKDKKKNIVQPFINEFKDRYLKSLEEFKIEGEFKDFVELYYLFKKSKMLYRLSLDKFKNLKFSSLKHNKSYISQCYL